MDSRKRQTALDEAFHDNGLDRIPRLRFARQYREAKQIGLGYVIR